MAIVLDGDIEKVVQKLAASRHCTEQLIMAEAVHQLAVREQMRGSLWQAGHAAWQQYQETGLHLTMEEMDSWMAKLEAGEDAELPKCHV